MNKELKIPLSILLGGYLFSLGFYSIWCFYFYYERLNRYDYLLVIAAVVFAITAIYFFHFILIWYIKSLQKVWIAFSLVSIITLLIFFFIPLANYKIYYRFNDDKLNLNSDKPIKIIDKDETEKKILPTNKKEIQKHVENAKEKIYPEDLETKPKFEIAMNDATKQLITELRSKLESERNKNAELRRQLSEIIKKTKSLEEEKKAKSDVVVQAKSNKNHSKTDVNLEKGNTDLDIKTQEIVFRVQITSSSTRIKTNSPQFKGLKNIWEYKHSGLYKYTVGTHKDLKSAFALQSELRKKGFKGAFVVSFIKGKRIPVREARKLLAESVHQ